MGIARLLMPNFKDTHTDLTTGCLSEEATCGTGGTEGRSKVGEWKNTACLDLHHAFPSNS